MTSLSPQQINWLQFGREEDDRIAHVATGETIVPMAVFEEDPALKEALFTRMREMGIDPERYVVGNELNSINPVTGQPEFFLKKIFKGIKKAVKGVVKVFKKVAPDYSFYFMLYGSRTYRCKFRFWYWNMVQGGES